MRLEASGGDHCQQSHLSTAPQTTFGVDQPPFWPAMKALSAALQTVVDICCGAAGFAELVQRPAFRIVNAAGEGRSTQVPVFRCKRQSSSENRKSETIEDEFSILKEKAILKSGIYKCNEELEHIPSFCPLEAPSSISKRPVQFGPGGRRRLGMRRTPNRPAEVDVRCWLVRFVPVALCPGRLPPTVGDVQSGDIHL